MTSEQRHTARFLRRRNARDEKQGAKSKQHAQSMEKVMTYTDIYKATKECYKKSSWKTSTQMYYHNRVINTAMLLNEIEQRKIKLPKGNRFTICERGKTREIVNLSIKEKIIQKVLRQKVLSPILEPTLIYNNGASIKGKGVAFTRNQLAQDLREFGKTNSDGYVLLVDFTKYFGNINKKKLQSQITRYLYDYKIRGLIFHLFDHDQDVGLSLVSENSQTGAIFYASSIDHRIKDQLSVKYYGRYNDDIYAISNNMEELLRIADAIREEAEKLDIVIKPNKVKICKLSHGFNYLKCSYKLSTSGKLSVHINPKSITRAVRKYKKFKEWVDDPTKTFNIDVATTSFNSWYGTVKKSLSPKQFRRIDKATQWMSAQEG